MILRRPRLGFTRNSWVVMSIVEVIRCTQCMWHFCSSSVCFKPYYSLGHLSVVAAYGSSPGTAPGKGFLLITLTLSLILCDCSRLVYFFSIIFLWLSASMEYNLTHPLSLILCACSSASQAQQLSGIYLLIFLFLPFPPLLSMCLSFWILQTYLRVGFLNDLTFCCIFKTVLQQYSQFRKCTILHLSYDSYWQRSCSSRWCIQLLNFWRSFTLHWRALNNQGTSHIASMISLDSALQGDLAWQIQRSLIPRDQFKSHFGLDGPLGSTFWVTIVWDPPYKIIPDLVIPAKCSGGAGYFHI